MKSRIFLAGCLLLLLSATLIAQNINPRKDLGFAQIAAGSGYETVLNITNRGTANYGGTLYLYRAPGVRWSPLVNGTAVINGSWSLTILPGETIRLRITVPGTIEQGFAVIRSAGVPGSQPDMHVVEQTNFLEGTLTYYVTSGTTVVDSIGIQPSSEVYLATIPFDDFNTIALALANANDRSANVKLTVYSAAGALVKSITQVLVNKQHLAQYLYQYPWQFSPGGQATRGRLDIQSDLPILIAALTDVGGQSSSLPLLPAVKAYTYILTVGGKVVDRGEMSLWFDGPYVQGYIRPFPDGPFPVLTSYLVGNLVNGILTMNYIVGENYSEPSLIYLVVNPFSPSLGTAEGTTGFGWSLLPPYGLQAGPGGQLKFTMTAVN